MAGANELKESLHRKDLGFVLTSLRKTAHRKFCVSYSTKPAVMRILLLLYVVVFLVLNFLLEDPIFFFMALTTYPACLYLLLRKRKKKKPQPPVTSTTPETHITEKEIQH